MSETRRQRSHTHLAHYPSRAAQRIRVPNTDIDDVGLLKRILRNAGVSDDVFINA
jgi:hypothetical protein